MGLFFGCIKSYYTVLVFFTRILLYSVLCIVETLVNCGSFISWIWCLCFHLRPLAGRFLCTVQSTTKTSHRSGILVNKGVYRENKPTLNSTCVYYVQYTLVFHSVGYLSAHLRQFSSLLPYCPPHLQLTFRFFHLLVCMEEARGVQYTDSTLRRQDVWKNPYIRSEFNCTSQCSIMISCSINPTAISTRLKGFQKTAKLTRCSQKI